MRRVVVPAALVALLLGAGNAYACACCADKGTWRQQVQPLRLFERSELARVRFAPRAADVPTPEGRAGTYRVAGSFTGPTWKIQLSGLPSLTFAAPSRATSFVADLYDGKLGRGGGPSLYKELRLAGASTGPGTHYRLILQGRGNNCLTAEDFRHWRLEVTGGKRKLAVYGTFRLPK